MEPVAASPLIHDERLPLNELKDAIVQLLRSSKHSLQLGKLDSEPSKFAEPTSPSCPISSTSAVPPSIISVTTEASPEIMKYAYLDTWFSSYSEWRRGGDTAVQRDK